MLVAGKTPLSRFPRTDFIQPLVEMSDLSMGEIDQESSSRSSESGDETIVADSIHSRVQHFYQHTKNALSKIMIESDTVFQQANQQKGRSQTPEIAPNTEILETRPSWTALPSVITWYKAPQKNDSEHSPLRFLSQIARPVKEASESVFLPLAVIGSNLADAWDLRDLAEDLRFRGGVSRPNQGGMSCSTRTPPFPLPFVRHSCQSGPPQIS